MKNRFSFLLCIASVAILLSSCQSHFISDATTHKAVDEAFEARRAHFTHGDVFAIFDEELSEQERGAMKFLYSSMSSADLGDYNGEFFLENVRKSLQAREEMAWGKEVPEDLFRHFVLPVRVNNERLDEFRMMYYDTLAQRVKGLSLHDAALEVNHWCHEKATYTPSDSRTSSPIATIINGEGRCGEESTLTVSAMRTVGIPARQVYTPRWAHTDSNHAWVEVWVDGRWQFMGACEPEPELNIGWFNQPAARAMLMHTRVVGDYHGPEDVIQRTNCFTEINVIDNYAPVRRSVVKVVDTEGKAVEGATIEFKIYNYAEYYTVVTLQSDANGEAVLHMGLGDMIVWASHEGRFGFDKLSAEELTIELKYKEGDAIEFNADVTPPVPGDIPVDVTEEAVALNKKRLAEEDKIRMAYTATFLTREQCADYSPAEQSLLIGARGNWRNIKAVIDSAKDTERQRVVALLHTLSRKDLHDTSLEVLQDALSTTADILPDNPQYRNIASPRIGSEFLQPYRTEIKSVLSAEIGQKPSATEIIKWTKENIALADEYNPIELQATPAGVLRLRYADAASRDRFFIAACRTFGIAARLNGMTGKAQYYDGEKWVDVVLDGEVAEQQIRTGSLRTIYDAKIVPTIPSPDYFSHYSISRIEDGRCYALNFNRGNDVDLGANAEEGLFAREFTLNEGYYILTTGNRMASGKALSRAVTFRIEEGKTTEIDLTIRAANDDIGVIGSMDAEQKYLPEGATAETSLLATAGRGYFIVAIMGSGDEPTNHALRGLASISDVLNKWGRPMIVLSPTAEDAAKFDKKMLGNIKAHFGIDTNDKVRRMICSGCNSQAKTLPVIAICDSFGRTVYFSQGYNTSLAEQLKYVIHKL